METTCINISTYEFYKYRSSSCYAHGSGSMSNLSLLIIVDNYYYSSYNDGKENGDWAGIWFGYWWM